nr:MAG TPA: hypothetical protein [Bacteriophage sp.]
MNSFLCSARALLWSATIQLIELKKYTTRKIIQIRATAIIARKVPLSVLVRLIAVSQADFISFSSTILGY